MVIGVGSDIAAVTRFGAWLSKSREQLNKIFTNAELDDCLNSDGQLLAEKLAVRFAAKEAFFKALSAACVSLQQTEKMFSFLFVCKNVQIKKSEWGTPYLEVDWDSIQHKLGSLVELSVHVSCSHERDHAIAFVVISRKN